MSFKIFSKSKQCGLSEAEKKKANIRNVGLPAEDVMTTWE